MFYLNPFTRMQRLLKFHHEIFGLM